MRIFPTRIRTGTFKPNDLEIRPNKNESSITHQVKKRGRQTDTRATVTTDQETPHSYAVRVRIFHNFRRQGFTQYSRSFLCLKPLFGRWWNIDPTDIILPRESRVRKRANSTCKLRGVCQVNTDILHEWNFSPLFRLLNSHQTQCSEFPVICRCQTIATKVL